MFHLTEVKISMYWSLTNIMLIKDLTLEFLSVFKLLYLKAHSTVSAGAVVNRVKVENHMYSFFNGTLNLMTPLPVFVRSTSF